MSLRWPAWARCHTKSASLGADRYKVQTWVPKVQTRVHKVQTWVELLKMPVVDMHLFSFKLRNKYNLKLVHQVILLLWSIFIISDTTEIMYLHQSTLDKV